MYTTDDKRYFVAAIHDFDGGVFRNTLHTFFAEREDDPHHINESFSLDEAGIVKRWLEDQGIPAEIMEAEPNYLDDDENGGVLPSFWPFMYTCCGGGPDLMEFLAPPAGLSCKLWALVDWRFEVVNGECVRRASCWGNYPTRTQPEASMDNPVIDRWIAEQKAGEKAA